MKPLDPREARLRAPGLAVLDVRDEPAFARGHWAGSGHIPAGELLVRRAELPPRDATLLVVGVAAREAAAAATAIEGLGYSQVFFLDAPLTMLPGGLADRGPAVRLWRPAPFLEEVLPRLAAHARSLPAPARVLDLAAGAGRDAVFLAQQGFAVEAWDHDPEALDRARDLAQRSGARLCTRVFDLESPELALPGHRFDVVTCFRFLHRPLFAWIERALAPGGWLVYETFLVGQERFGRPRRPQFLLERGELARAFPRLETVRLLARKAPETG
jgi:SAM-dependent methyltransferase